MTSFSEKLLDALFPRTRCMACNGTQQVVEGLCAACRDKMERWPQQDVCAICGQPAAGRERCLICRQSPPEYTAARAVFLYDGPARQLVLRMKFHGEFDLPARLLSRELAQLAHQLGWPVDAVIGVPAAPKTLRKRGYNQSELLARRTARLLHLPFLRRTLRKKRGTRSQIGLSAQQRLLNLQGSILPGRNAAALRGKRILLVDDVFTTGATARLCAQALFDCGATAVYILCATRVADTALSRYLASE